jgi:repressor LexA
MSNHPSDVVTPRQIEALGAIADFRARQRYSATIGEIAEALDVSRPTLFEHVAALREKGLLRQSEGRARSLLVTARGQRLLERIRQGESEITDAAEAGEAIPLSGSVAAGQPIEAIEGTGSVSIRGLFGPGDDLFALQVVGDSMIDEGIHSGDYVLCRRACTAENGQIVVAVVEDNNATLKRFYKEPRRVRLQPANEHYDPIYSSDCRIEAVVVGQIRRLT